jgi:hypothetical protein
MNIINLLILLILTISVYLLIYYKTDYSKNTQSPSSLVKSSLNPNEYYPTLVDDTNSFQSLVTDPLDLNYNISTGTLFAKDISANFNGTSASALNLEKNGTGNLLLQTNSNTTSLLPQGTSGQVLISQLNSAPIWTNAPEPTSTYMFPNPVFFGIGSLDVNYGPPYITIGGGEDRSRFYRNFTLQNGTSFAPNGNKMFISGTLTLNGIIANNGTNASGAVGGICGRSYSGDTRNITGRTALSSYVSKTPPRAPEMPNTFKSGSGIPYFSGGNGGFVNSSSWKGDGGYARILYNIQTYLTQPFISSLSVNLRDFGNVFVNGGAAGGCGESVNVNGTVHLGGGGGGGGGIIHICANEIIVGSTARIEARGGNGGNSTRGGGGGGGGGGLIFIVTRRIRKSDGSQLTENDFLNLCNVNPGVGGDGQTNLSLSARGVNAKGINGEFGRIVIIYL